MRRTIFQRKCEPTTRIEQQGAVFGDRDFVDQHLRRFLLRVVVGERAEVAEAASAPRPPARICCEIERPRGPTRRTAWRTPCGAGDLVEIAARHGAVSRMEPRRARARQRAR